MMPKKCCVCGHRIPAHDFAIQTAKGLACSNCLVSRQRRIPPYGEVMQRQAFRKGQLDTDLALAQ